MNIGPPCQAPLFQVSRMPSSCFNIYIASNFGGSLHEVPCGEFGNKPGWIKCCISELTQLKCGLLLGILWVQITWRLCCDFVQLSLQIQNLVGHQFKVFGNQCYGVDTCPISQVESSGCVCFHFTIKFNYDTVSLSHMECIPEVSLCKDGKRVKIPFYREAFLQFCLYI